MKRWMKRPAIAVLFAVSLALFGLFAGYVVLAQGPASGPGERDEGNGGTTGQILEPTSEQLKALQTEELTPRFHFAGALNDTGTSSPKATVVQCTNTDDAEDTTIEVQLFQYNASAVYTGTINVEPMKTATFESSQVVFYSADVFLDAGFVEQGYGRILTEHANVICTVQTVDPENSPPTWSFDIPVYVGPFHNGFLPAVIKE